MKQTQVVYIHGGDGFDSLFEAFSVWKQVLKSKLSQCFKPKKQKWPDRLELDLADRTVVKLKMPCKYNAKYKAWAQHFESQFAAFDEEVILLGWSLGANFLAKYLSENEVSFSVKAVHLVAGCYGLGGGFELSPSFPGRLVNLKVYLYHSKDDFVVDFKDFEQYKAALPKAKTQIFEDRNHFLQPVFPEIVKHIKSEPL